VINNSEAKFSLKSEETVTLLVKRVTSFTAMAYCKIKRLPDLSGSLFLKANI
jgi:hypothetical protein